MRVIAISAVLVSALAAGPVFAFVPSKCDSGITKAAGKKVACKAGVTAGAQKKGGTPDSAKLAKCTDKFTKACSKAKAAGDCKVQTQTCAQIETEADSCVSTISSSPSGAFLE